jgi:hypothetical protein
VGTNGLTLSVFGSNFGSTSTVEWNQAALATTLVSGTQLSAVVPPANLATAVAATVTVSNQGAAGTAPIVSGAVTFNVVPDIGTIVSQLQAISANPPQLITQLQTYITVQQAQNDSLNTQVNTDQTTEASLNSQIAGLQATVSQQQTQIATLTAEVNATQSQSASPLDVAQSFKSVMDTIQQNAQAAGGVQTTVTNMNVQVKSLLSVQAATSSTAAGATLTFPSPTALPDPAHLSTLNFSLGAIPNLQTPAVSPTPTPTPTPAPTPAPPTPPPTPPPPTPAPASKPAAPVTSPAKPSPAAKPASGPAGAASKPATAAKSDQSAQAGKPKRSPPS